MNSWKALIPIIFVSQLNPAVANQKIDIQKFLNLSLKSSHDVAIAKSRWDVEKIRLMGASNGWANKLELIPSHKKSTFRQEGFEKYSRTQQIFTAQTIQSFPTSTVATLSGTWAKIKNDSSGDETSPTSFSLMVEQPLWRDSFGNLQRKSESLQKGKTEIERENLLRTQRELCQVATNEYLQTHRLQKRIGILKQWLDSSAKKRREVEDAVSRKLLRRLDLYGARASESARKISHQVERRNFHLKLTEAFERWGQSYDPASYGTIELVDPKEWISTDVGEPSFENAPNPMLWKVESLMVESGWDAVRIEKEKSKSSWDVFAKGSKEKTFPPTQGPSVIPLKEDSIEVGLKVGFDVFNPKNNSNEQAAIASWGTQKINLEKKKVELQVDIKKSLKNYSELKEQYNLHAELLNSLEAQERG